MSVISVPFGQWYCPQYHSTALDRKPLGSAIFQLCDMTASKFPYGASVYASVKWG